MEHLSEIIIDSKGRLTWAGCHSIIVITGVTKVNDKTLIFHGDMP